MSERPRLGADRLRWRVTRADEDNGWFWVSDRGPTGKGPYERLAYVFSRGRAEIVADTLEAAYPAAADTTEAG